MFQMQNTALKVQAWPTLRPTHAPAPTRAPKVSVILPIYNAERYLESAIRSILRQSFFDFELIAVDDGSTDHSGMILDWLATQDVRIVILRQSNAGVTKALNAGLAIARGDYIARMDADDIAQPNRFARQVAELDKRPDVVALGTQFCLIDPEGRPLKKVPVPLDHADLDQQLFARQDLSICHPSVMMRAKALKEIGGYDERYSSAQDVDLFLRLAEVGELANLEDELMNYRIHTQSMGYQVRSAQIQNAWRAGKRAAARRNKIFRTPHPDTAEYQRSKADICRMWGWWAMTGGHTATARYYGRHAVMRNPFSRHNWKLMLFSLRGH